MNNGSHRIIQINANIYETKNKISQIEKLNIFFIVRFLAPANIQN